MTKIEKLMFQVSLLDKISAPLSKIQKKFGALKNTALSSIKSIGIGFAGLAATGFGLKTFVNPALVMQKSLAQVASLGVGDESLKTLNNAALRYSVQYGDSARDFVTASYDIQSSIDRINGNQLSSITRASAILAKGTKSDVATITNFMGTMYGIFKQDARAMGVDKWSENIAGMTAKAVQMFKTTGQGMSDAFGNLGASGQSFGIVMNEQMAILGTLQSTMSGSEAATKYKAFLDGAGKAQKQLGLQFVDSRGKMLPMVKILQLIQGKYGDLSKVADSDLLKKAFGTKEAVAIIKLLGADIDGLDKSIKTLGKNKGMATAIKMAKKLADPWDKALKGIEAVRINMGQSLLPVLNPLMDRMAAISGEILTWTEKNPALTKSIGMAVLKVLALVAGLTSLAIVGGTVKLALVVLTPLFWLLRNAMVAVRAVAFIGFLATLATNIGLTSSAMAIWNGIIWLTNAALWANPITWVVGGILLLIATVVAVIYYWDDLKLMMGDTRWTSVLMFALNTILTPFRAVIKAIEMLMSKWQSLKSVLSTPLSGVVGGILNKTLPGMGASASPAAVAPVSGLSRSPVAIPGLSQMVNMSVQAMGGGSSNGVRVDKVEIHSHTDLNAENLMRELELLGR